MALTIREKADTLGTWRWASVFLMETLARWVPTTPELEVKTLFGLHVWDLAQHADELGKRTNDLRAPLHYSRRPAAGYAAALEALGGAAPTAERVAGFYDAALPDLERRYRAYLEETDHLLDQPTVRVLERLLRDIERMQADRRATQAERSDLALAAPAWSAGLATRFAPAAGMVEPRPAAGVGAEVA
jgi:hypothetical protein